MDRQNSMSSLFAMGNEVAAGCDVTERKAIEKQLKTLMLRFDQLTGSAQQRMLDLEQAMKVVIVHYIFNGSELPNLAIRRIDREAKIYILGRLGKSA